MGLVQETSGSATGTSLTLTFASQITARDAVIIATCGYVGGSLTAITIGGTSAGFTKQATSTNVNCEIWANLSGVTPATQITITASAAGIAAWAYEVEGPAALDNDAWAYSLSGGTSWATYAGEQTAPYAHFAVGLGFTESAGTITPASGGGWTNLASYHDVAGASAFGGVSGYQTAPDGLSSYEYSGTTQDSGNWGAVAATFLTPAIAVIPNAEMYTLQPAWGGYVFAEHSSYTGVSATFTLPSTMPSTSGALCSVWVGLGDVNQIGIYLGYQASAGGDGWTSPWTWWIPGAGEIWDENTFPADLGDSMTLSMTLDGAYWHMTMTNNTQDWSFTDVMAVKATNLNSWNTGSSGAVTTPAWIYPVRTAEVIIEKEAPELNDYGSITFTDISTVPAATVAPYPVFTANTYLDQYPGTFTLNAGTGSFTMYYWYAD